MLCFNVNFLSKIVGKIDKMFEGYNGWMLGSGFAGLALIIAGSLVDNTLSQTIGGALFGAAVGGFVSLLDANRIWKFAINQIKETIGSEFRGEESKAEKYRKIWYLYYVSKMNGKHVWRLHVLDFSMPIALGELRASVKVKGTMDDVHIYNYVAAFRDSRLIMFAKEDESDEPCAVYIFPYMGEAYQAINLGIAILRTWDMTNSVSPAIITEYPIKGLDNEKVDKDNVIQDPNLIKELNSLWEKRFREINELFPLPRV